MQQSRRSAPQSGPSTATSVRHGVVAVIVRDDRFLVIRRSQTVAAPGAYCFPGGGIEAGESEQQALVRELREELAVTVDPQRRLWESTTPWGVHLAWWLVDLAPSAELVPNPAEVESCHWHTPAELDGLAELLDSNRQFLAALAQRTIVL
jgi:8-oxo-dGTP diphosphatase